MYCLVIFYQATSEETAPLRPLPQMLCVKFAIFGSFFQQIIISLLVNLIYTCINKNTTDQTMASAAPPECLLSKSEMASEIHVSTTMYVCVCERVYVCICVGTFICMYVYAQASRVIYKLPLLFVFIVNFSYTIFYSNC